jgi:hypothetical protein
MSELSTATFGSDGRYRYLLTRRWRAPGPSLGFVMLNPSTADDVKNDATIRRCVGFAKGWGYAGITVANLYAYRATRPSDLRAARRAGIDIVGPGNVATLQTLPRDVVVAWGNLGQADKTQAAAVLEALAASGHAIWRFGLTGRGHPRHPLRLAASTVLEPHE